MSKPLSPFYTKRSKKEIQPKEIPIQKKKMKRKIQSKITTDSENHFVSKELFIFHAIGTAAMLVKHHNCCVVFKLYRISQMSVQKLIPIVVILENEEEILINSLEMSKFLSDSMKIFDEEFGKLVREVREHRSKMSICPSAQDGVDVAAILLEFCDNDFYKEDYQAITSYFAADYVSYEDSVAVIRKLAESERWRTSEKLPISSKRKNSKIGK